MLLQYAVIGLGEFGRSVLNALILEGCDVIAIDQDENKIQEISPLVTYSVAIDAADESALISAGIK
nr:NAD-binding protein [bacterium]